MINLAIHILNLCILPFKMFDNLVVLLPLAFLIVLGLFGIVKRVVTNEY